MPGPVAETNEEREATGRKPRSRNAHQTAEFGEVAEDSPAPDMLNAIGKALWTEKLRELVKAGILKTHDKELLLAYCIAYQNLSHWTIRLESAITEEKKKIKEGPSVVISKEGKEEKDWMGYYAELKYLGKEIMACSQRQSRCLVEIQNLGAKLGANPVDRGKVKVKPVKKESKFGQFTGASRAKS